MEYLLGEERQKINQFFQVLKFNNKWFYKKVCFQIK